MTVTLAILEGSSIFAAASWAIFVLVRPVWTNWIDVAAALGQAVALSLCFIIVFYFNDLYDLRIVRSFGESARRLARPFGIVLILLAAFYTLFPETRSYGKSFAPVLLVILALLLSLRAVFYRVMRGRPFIKRVLILGTTPMAHQLIEEIEAHPLLGYTIVGLVDDAMPSGELRFRYPLLGPLEHLGKIIEEVQPDRIIVALADRRRHLPTPRLLEARARGIVVEDGVDVYERLTGKLPIEWLAPSSLIFSKEFRKSRVHLALARGLSLLAAVLGLVSLAPLLGLIALAIKLDSSGPVFCVQDRVGMGGRPFKLVKFRTMHPVDRETSLWFQDNRDRITRLGKWLRKFRLDEFPQFVNILRGDMNLVGPRPHRIPKFEMCVLVHRNLSHISGEAIPYFSLRSVVPPGLTGWAQVRNGYACSLEDEIEKTRYDLYYIKHLSLWLDLRVLFETVKIVFFDRGSAAPEARRSEPRRGVSRLWKLRKKLDQKTAA